MIVATIVLGHASIHHLMEQPEGLLIGVDGGALLCAQQNWTMDYAISDFDSVNQEEFEFIQMRADQIIQLESEKDESDFEAALKLASEADQIVVYGWLGGRFDHAFVHLKLIQLDPRIIFIDSQNRVRAFDKGSYLIKKDQYPYISLFAFDQEVMISLSGVHYALIRRELTPLDRYTLSNEIIESHAELIVHDGRVLVIQSKD